MSTKPEGLCVYCACATGIQEHHRSCPFNTGIYPLDEALQVDGAVCGHCKNELVGSYATVWEGVADSEEHEEIATIVCVPCKILSLPGAYGVKSARG